MLSEVFFVSIRKDCDLQEKSQVTRRRLIYRISAYTYEIKWNNWKNSEMLLDIMHKFLTLKFYNMTKIMKSIDKI